MKEQLSALMDSELSPAEAAQILKSMKTDQALHEAWNTYHVLGDALCKSPQMRSDFNARLAQRLAQEPTILAPQGKRFPTVIKHFPISIAASVAAVSLVGILALQISRLNQDVLPQQVASAPTASPVQQVALATNPEPTLAKHETKSRAVAASIPAQVKFTNATPGPYLLAHQEYSPSYAPAYVRVVSEPMDGNR